ncbi:MAG: aldo/keto reductase [Clostridia bacterium]|nr:aldo/keto reductase [Clostridia bacterium]
MKKWQIILLVAICVLIVAGVIAAVLLRRQHIYEPMDGPGMVYEVVVDEIEYVETNHITGGIYRLYAKRDGCVHLTLERKANADAEPIVWEAEVDEALLTEIGDAILQAGLERAAHYPERDPYRMPDVTSHLKVTEPYYTFTVTSLMDLSEWEQNGWNEAVRLMENAVNEPTYPVEYWTDIEYLENAKPAYPAGASVLIYFDLIATDTDYKFLLDGEPLNFGFDESKGFVISFVMPAHAVKLECEMRNSMMYDPYAHTEETASFDFASKTVMLNSGYEMPIIGLGTWTLDDEQAGNSVYHALKCGMRLIDTARYYGNEVGVGKGLQKAIGEGIVTREDVFITSKIYGGSYEQAGSIINDALKDLNVDYIDLLLIHQPGSDDEGVYRAMEEAVIDGRLRSIGISNYYTKEAVDEVLSFATIPPAVIQNENHLFYQNNELREYVKQYGIVLESWYPFGGRGHTDEHFGNEVIVRLAEKYGKTAAQIILRWQIQAGYVVIPGSSNPDHIAENYHVFDFELTPDEMAQITALDRQERYENW